MVAFQASFCLLALLGLIEAVAIPPHHEVHEKRATLHPRWTKGDRVEPHKLLPMRIGLTQSNLDNGYEHLMDVADPASPNFGKHWTSEEVIAAFRPSKQTEDGVRDWLVKSGIPATRISHSENKAWFAFYATAEEAENLLFTEYHEYEDSVTGGVIPACDEYHVPKHVREHIDYISPGIKLLAPPESLKSKRDLIRRKEGVQELETRLYHQTPKVAVETNADPSDLSTCDELITPACIAALYEIPPGTSANPNNTMGLFESELEFYRQDDLDAFFTIYPSPAKIPNGTHPVAANIDGGQQSTTDPLYYDVEVNLDLEVAYPILYPQTITLYQVDDFIVQANQNDTYTFGFNTFLDALDGSYCTFSAYNETGNDPYLDQVYPDPAQGGWLGELMCGVYKPTNVISLSYGGQEADFPISYQRRQCLEYLKLGLQGVSFLFASGDTGVGNYPFGIDGPTGCLGPDLNIFNPTFPSTCPYVTSVGETQVPEGSTVFEPEIPVFFPNGYPHNTNYSSGGGFSNVYPIPKYQQSAVATFFENYGPPYKNYSALAPDTGDIRQYVDVGALAGNTGGIYNRIGRGYPDVAANGARVAVHAGGLAFYSGGTSGATPMVAAIINRINEERLNAGKGPIGFLNPSLYANPSMLNDIMNGTSSGCGTSGFPAVPGWDPVSGLGTPNYPRMLEYYMSLP